MDKETNSSSTGSSGTGSDPSKLGKAKELPIRNSLPPPNPSRAAMTPLPSRSRARTERHQNPSRTNTPP